MMGFNEMDGYWWVYMMLFWALMVFGIVALVRYTANDKKSESSKTPLAILKERYAKGEINKKEFEEKKKDLS